MFIESAQLMSKNTSIGLISPAKTATKWFSNNFLVNKLYQQKISPRLSLMKRQLMVSWNFQIWEKCLKFNCLRHLMVTSQAFHLEPLTTVTAMGYETFGLPWHAIVTFCLVLQKTLAPLHELWWIPFNIPFQKFPSNPLVFFVCILWKS